MAYPSQLIHLIPLVNDYEIKNKNEVNETSIVSILSKYKSFGEHKLISLARPLKITIECMKSGGSYKVGVERVGGLNRIKI